MFKIGKKVKFTLEQAKEAYSPPLAGGGERVINGLARPLYHRERDPVPINL
jgi:hypothetical protein